MNVLNLLKLDYWFSQPYIAYGTVKWFWIVLFLFFVLLGIVAKFWEVLRAEKNLKRVFKSFAATFWSIGVFGLLWMFFRQEHVPFLAWRFWLLLIFVFVVWRQFVNIKFLVKRYPQIKKENEARELKEKYLP